MKYSRHGMMRFPWVHSLSLLIQLLFMLEKMTRHMLVVMYSGSSSLDHLPRCSFLTILYFCLRFIEEFSYNFDYNCLNKISFDRLAILA